MNNIIVAFYLIFLLGCFVASVFIAYHITRYSINKKTSTGMLLLFIFVLAILLLINFSIFINLEITEIINFNSGSFNFNPSSF